ncbi:MAG: hypothetical protein R2714_05075 [Microthrixaceae bacterium]
MPGHTWTNQVPCAAMVFLGGALIASQAAKLGLWLSFVAEFIMLAAGVRGTADRRCRHMRECMAEKCMDRWNTGDHGAGGATSPGR